MSRGTNQKYKFTYLMQIMLEKTDDEHGITKVKKFASEHQAKQLQRQVFINDRVKTMNESVYCNVDYIHTAINSNKKIRFKYYSWDINKELVARHNGEWYVVSPWALTWDDENYYMVAFDEVVEELKASAEVSARLIKL